MFNSIGRLAAIVVGFILCNAASAQCFGSLWGLDEVFSNSDGSVQFVMLQSAKGNGVTGSLAGQTLVASDGSTQHSYTFGSDLPDVWAHPVLVATQGFADLNLVKPDFILPNGFVFPRDGTLSLVSGEWCGGPVHYDTLPTDGVRAYFPDAWGDGYAYVGIAQVANNAGQYYQFTTGGLPPLGATIGPGFTGAWSTPRKVGTASSSRFCRPTACSPLGSRSIQPAPSKRGSWASPPTAAIQRRSPMSTRRRVGGGSRISIRTRLRAITGAR